MILNKNNLLEQKEFKVEEFTTVDVAFTADGGNHMITTFNDGNDKLLMSVYDTHGTP